MMHTSLLFRILLLPILLISVSAHAQNLGALKIQYALDKRVENFTPDKLFGGDIKTPRKGKPFLYVAWRHDMGDPGSGTFRFTTATLNVMQDDPRAFGLSLLLEKDKKPLHYVSRCSPRTAPKCDPTTQGMRHDPVTKKLYLQNTVFERLSLDKTDPSDTVTVSGELGYAH